MRSRRADVCGATAPGAASPRGELALGKPNAIGTSARGRQGTMSGCHTPMLMSLQTRRFSRTAASGTAAAGAATISMTICPTLGVRSAWQGSDEEGEATQRVVSRRAWRRRAANALDRNRERLHKHGMKPTKPLGVAAAAAALVACSGAVAAPVVPSAASVEAHVAAAKDAAGSDLGAIFS